MAAASKSTGLALLAACLAIGVASAQIPRDGPIDWSLCFGGPTHVVSPTPQDRFGTYAVTGATRGAAGLAESLSVECVGTFEILGSASKSQGYCLYQDRAGDRIYGTDNRTPAGYTWELLGGTGKYAGITGRGTTEILGIVTPVRPGTLQGCRRLVGSYKLP